MIVQREGTSIVRVAIDGDEIEAVRDGEKAWVVVRRVCEVLGLDAWPQRRKLQAAPWACSTIMVLRDSSGRRQEQLCLDLDSLPMWLATINTSKVRAALRPKLVTFQIHAARILRDVFFGRPSLPPVALSTDIAIIKTDVAHISKRLEQYPGFAGRVGDSDHTRRLMCSAMQACAKATSESFSTVHGALRREYKLTGYLYLPINWVPVAVKWCREKAIERVSKQLTFWPDGES